MTTLLLYVLVAAIVLTTLLMFDEPEVPHVDSHSRFLDCFFEAVSALGTVGLSMGKTAGLSGIERLVVMLAMLIGRLGPISIAIALSRSQRAVVFEYPKEEILIG
jgi:trk system potassium uptake protein TrkH